jgi:hypothetical protein
MDTANIAYRTHRQPYGTVALFKLHRSFYRVIENIDEQRININIRKKTL